MTGYGQKFSKIVSELMMALVSAGAKDVNIEIHRRETGMDVKLTGDYPPEKREEIFTIRDLLSNKRVKTSTELYWELLDSGNLEDGMALKLIAQVVDTIFVDIKSDNIAIRFAQKFR